MGESIVRIINSQSICYLLTKIRQTTLELATYPVLQQTFSNFKMFGG